MDPSLWLALLGAQTLISFVPGAGAVNTMSNALTVGFRRTVWGVLGQQAALLVHIAIAAAGVGILVSNSPLAFDLIRYAGAAYLVYLGIRKFLQRPEHSDIRALQTDESALSMVRRGIWVNLLNPKAIVFFLALIPQFISPDRPLLAQYGVLTATVIGIDFLVMWFFYGGTARSFRRFTQHDRGQVILNRIFGSLFVGVGALLALA
ncbi:lysine transporter LysE [Arthrobacter sp. RIT-PI-e]|uniref:LysE family transporter n=1 Tax=Arthrobacter sp. RIT-PI-e TaxID=1681197 RepID=UPI000676545D|nr:LysE family transporter [Arthrobacter sp. RIT-PI-e]KNC18682.1 lysine transporter LysE [Arthrobacter sp. RIT-PI-e]